MTEGYNKDVNACLTRLEKDIADQTNSYITVSRDDLKGVVIALRSELEGDGA